MEAALLDGDAQGLAVAQQMGLSGEFIHIAGTHAVGQGLAAGILGIEEIIAQDGFSHLRHRHRVAA